MKRYYIRHESLKGVISFKKIAELWNGDEVETVIKGKDIIIRSDDMGNVIADRKQSGKNGDIYEMVERGENGEVGK